MRSGKRSHSFGEKFSSEGKVFGMRPGKKNLMTQTGGDQQDLSRGRRGEGHNTRKPSERSAEKISS